MNYKTARRLIETSSWFKELTELDFPAARIINLSRPCFERELQIIIDRHKRQQVHIDLIKQICHVKLTT